MKALFVSSLLAFCTWRILALAASDPLAVTLEVSNATAKRAATNAISSDHHKALAQPVFRAKANEHLTLHWMLAAKGDTVLVDVLVHFYVARVDESGQPPDLAKPDNVVLEGALTMDFRERNSAQSSLTFRVPKPGRYLVRVEAKHDDLSPLEEPFATVDLEVK